MKFFYFIAMVILVASCSPGVKRMDPPKDLIQKEKMVDLMTELMKLEGHVVSKHVQLTRYYKVISNSGDSLLKSNGYNQSQFERSMDYYAFQQTDLRDIYVEVLERLNKEMADLEKEAGNSNAIDVPTTNKIPTKNNH